MNVSFYGNKRALEKDLYLLFSIFFGQSLIWFTLLGERLIPLNCVLSSFYAIIIFTIFRFGYSHTNTGFSLDDIGKIIRTEKGSTIPYNKVKSITISRMDDALSVSATRSMLKRYTLYYADNVDEQDRLTIELKKIFSNVKVKKMSTRRIKLLLWILHFALPVGIGGYYIFTYYNDYPALRIFPEKKIIKENCTTFERGTEYKNNNIGFFLPHNFSLRKREEKKLIFVDPDNETRIRVSADGFAFFDELTKDFHPFFIYLAGIKDDYDLLELIYYNKLGLIPLMFKFAFITECEDFKIYEIEKKHFKGFLSCCSYWRGLYIFDKKQGCAINFDIHFKNIDTSFIDMLIIGVH